MDSQENFKVPGNQRVKFLEELTHSVNCAFVNTPCLPLVVPVVGGGHRKRTISPIDRGEAHVQEYFNSGKESRGHDLSLSLRNVEVSFLSQLLQSETRNAFCLKPR